MEICVEDLESAVNAVNGGAHRLEVCSALREGGFTPRMGLYKTLKLLKMMDMVEIFIMLRPKHNYNFHYSDLDMEIILQDCLFFKKAGANGFVFGALTLTGDIDIEACASVISVAYPLPITFHRAFDVAKQDPIQMAQKIADLGFKRLLTSGRSLSVSHGKYLIKLLIEILGDRLIIMPISGITVENLKDILVTTMAHEFHASAKVLRTYSNRDPAYVTHQNTVRKLRRIYNKYLKIEHKKRYS